MRLGRQFYGETRRLLSAGMNRHDHMLAMALSRRAILRLLTEKHNAEIVRRHSRQIDAALDSIKQRACFDVLAHREG